MLEAVKNFVLIQMNKPRWLRRTLGLKPQGIAYVKFHDHRYYLYLGDLYGPSYHLMHWGVSTYEPDNRRFIRKVVGEDGVFLDVGANIGIFSLVAALQGPKVKVYAFDPDEKARECLAASMAANSCNNIEILPYAISSEEGDGVFYIDEKNHGGNSLDQDSIEVDKNTTLARKTVKLTTVDNFVGERKMGKIDLIKIDVQSHEHEVLVGATKTIEKLRPVVFVECSSVHIGGPKDPFNHFKDLNYDVFDPLMKVRMSVPAAQDLYKQKSAYYDLFFYPKEKQELFKL